MHWLAFYSHMENTWMAALFHLTPPLFIEMPYHSRKISSHAYVCLGYRCCLFLQFYYWFSERVYFSTWSFFRHHRDPFVHFIWHLITPTHSFTLQLFDTKCHIFLLWLTHLFTHDILKSTHLPISLCVLRNVIYYVIIFCQVGLQMKGVLIIEE